MQTLTLKTTIAMMLVALTTNAKADDGDCNGIDWSVRREQGWFANRDLPRRASGARLRKINRAVQLQLKTLNRIDFFLPPAIPPRNKSYAGEVTFFGVPRPGAYVLTLSQPGHLDVFENGMRIKPEVTESATECNGVSTSARYDLQRGALVLVQVTDVASNAIKIAFAAAP